MKKIWKKLLAVTLAASLTMSMVSMTSLAAEEGENEETSTPTTYCGLEEHTHSKNCYEGDGWTEDQVGDKASIYVLDQDTNLYYVSRTCGKEKHTHTSGCYASPVAATIGGVSYPTLQDAINAAVDGKTVLLQKDVAENVTITGKTITLDLNGKTVNGDQKGTVLTINGGNVTLIGDGTITGGKTKAWGYGGGITILGGATVTMDMDKGKITGNVNGDATHNGNGGGVFVKNGHFIMNSGEISGNTAKNSGGGVCVYNYNDSETAKFTMNGGTISGNHAGIGGGVDGHGSHRTEVRDVIVINAGTITGNTADNGGGIGISTTNEGNTGDALNRLVINGGATITNNTSVNYGGGIYISVADVELSGCRVTNNTTAGSGGGIYLGNGNSKLESVTITGNTANQGGGIFGTGPIDLTSCFITENTAEGTTGVGGGLRFGPSAVVTMDKNRVTNNTAKQGGGVYIFGGNGGDPAKTTLVMNGGVLYGNHSTNSSGSHSADVYSNTATLTLPEASTMGGRLNGKNITGWFWDGGGAYKWSSEYCVERTPNNTTTNQFLIAAYAFPKHVDSFSITALYTPLTYMGEERLKAAKEAIENFDSLGITRITSLDEDGWCQIDMPDNNEVTLLFEIHVRGKVGMQYNVTSEGSTYVGGDPLEGTIPNRNPDVAGMVSTTTYVTKHYTLEDIVVNQYGNWLGDSAIVTPGVERNEDGLTVNESTTYREDWVKVILPELYTVTYTDGVEDSEVFADRSYAVAVNDPTPAFEGTPTREGYTFTGWSPAVAETVTDNVTYVAQWNRNSVPPTFYTLTINYVDGEGNAVADTYTRDLREGRSYSVVSPAVEGMTPDQATVSGILNGNTTLTVTYTRDPEPTSTETPNPTESPEESEDLGENDTPLTDGPETSEPPVEPTETPDEGEDLGDNDTPLADVPQTGDMLWLWMTLAAGSAVSLAWISAEEKKGKRVSK